MRGQYRKDAAFFIALHGKMDIAYGCREKALAARNGRGDPRPHNPFLEKA